MAHREFTWQSRDGLKMFAREWSAAEQPRGIVYLIHGLGEHSGRYAHVAAKMNQANYTVRAFDHRGHGRSEGKRGYTPSYEALLDDIQDFMTETPSDDPNNIFLYGHSLGGNLVLNFALKRRPNISGVISTSPLILPGMKIPGIKIALGKLMNRLFPALTFPNDINPDHISRNKSVAIDYANDPLVHNRVSARLGTSMLQAGEWALEHAQEFPLPLLLMHGSADQITSPEASKKFAEKVPVECTFKMWEGCYHELHNEPEKDQVIAFMIDWLNAHT